MALKVMQILREEMNYIGGQEFSCRRCIRQRFGKSQAAGRPSAMTCFA